MRIAITTFALALLVGCGTLRQGESTFIVRSEQTIEGAAATMEAFMGWADANRRMIGLDAARVAQHIKDNGADYLQSATLSLDAYKAGVGERSSVEAALGMLARLTAEVGKYLEPETRGGFR